MNLIFKKKFSTQKKIKSVPGASLPAQNFSVELDTPLVVIKESKYRCRGL